MTQQALVYEKEKRIFTESEARLVVSEVASYIPAGSQINIEFSSWWGAGQRWARNKASLTSDQREVTLQIMRRLANGNIAAAWIYAVTNQTDSASLKGISDHITYYYNKEKKRIPPDRIIAVANGVAEGADVWSDSTFDRSVVDNANAVEQLTRLSENENLMSAGYIESSGCTALHYSRDEWDREKWHWGNVTQAQCSVTVRDKGANGSAWAGKTSFDIDRVDISKLSSYALERCKQSLNPVRIEPGRYQVILEPQATATFTDILMNALMRSIPEGLGRGPIYLGYDNSVRRFKSKFDLKLVDDRVNIFHEPSNPHFGAHVAPLHRRADFIKNGVLVGLMDTYWRNLNEVSTIYPTFPTTSYRMDGGKATLDDMISSSKRALLVAKFSQPEEVDKSSLLSTGLTRDGLWLIENGAITKPVRNFKWTESPLFALNNIEDIGNAEQVFSPNVSRSPLAYDFSTSLNNIVVPYLRINDFSFTSTIDAV